MREKESGPHVKLVSMTLVHAGAAAKLADALRSASFVDAHLVLDTTPDNPVVRQTIDSIWPEGRIDQRSIIVRSYPWPGDFSTARNELFQQAASLVEGDTWGIVLDSDERLICDDPKALRLELSSPSAMMGLTYDVDEFYRKERLFRLPTHAQYVGFTHEAPINTGQAIDPVQHLKFWELQKSNEEFQQKLRRDVTLLRRQVKATPCDARWWYYLGDTLDSLGQKLEATDAFVQCAKLRGWDEEGAWACYRGATILLARERYQEAIDIAAKGLARHPGVAELCWVASVASFRAGLKDKATYWARMCVALGDHVGVNLSRSRAGFRHLPALFELPYDVLRFAAPTQEQRDEADREFWKAKLHRYGGPVEEAAIRRGPNSAKWEARNDVGRHAKVLGDLAQDVRIIPIPNPSRDGYHPMNPSLTLHRGKLVATIRTVNYVIDDVGRYIMPPDDKGVVKTVNYLADVSPIDFSVSNIRTIQDKTGKERFPTLVRGYEDLRLASVNETLYASATVRDHDPHMRCQIAICELNEQGEIVRDWDQSSPRDEKNWMPFVQPWIGLSFVYSVDPTVIVNFDPETGIVREVARSTPTVALDHVRGGSQVIALPSGEGWLGVVHEVVILDDRRRYLHRFARFDDRFRLTHLSHAWRYGGPLRIEFAAGLALLEDQGSIVMGVGIDDHEACFVVMPLAEAIRLGSAIACT
jgi:tetratricopeptide (TPR) repeat protein